MAEPKGSAAAQLGVLRDELIALAQINSGSGNVSGVDAVGEHMAARLRALGAEVELLSLPPRQVLNAAGEFDSLPVGRLLRAKRQRGNRHSVLLGGHLDTVFAADDPFQDVRQQDAETLHGPGVADLKGGLLVMCEALKQLEASGSPLDWEVILNPDEEIGSPSSAAVLTEAAQHHSLGLVFEPALPGGVLAAGRKGSGNFNLIVRGRSAHAGRDHALGRNAIRALAELTVAIDALNGQRDGVTVNPATVRGGGTINRVPDLAQLDFNVRVTAPEHSVWIEQQLAGLVADYQDRDGLTVNLHGGFHRPPKPRTAALETLYGWLAHCAEELSLPLSWVDTGGCCDGNNLAAAGLVNLDTLGVIGGAIHSDQEWMNLPSLLERSALAGRLLRGLATGEFDPLALAAAS